MRIALTGVSGFIGSAIARHLRDAGHAVTGLVRSTSRRDHIEPFVDRFVVGAQDDESCWSELLDGTDAVIHNAVDWTPLRAPGDLDAHLRTNLHASIKLLNNAAPRQFVFISTIAVHHDMSDRWQGVIDETHPLRPGNLYGAYKAAVEAHLHAARHMLDMHTCAVRPCGVYGIDPNLERSHGFALIEKLQRGEPADKSGGGKFVHVEDVAAATVATLGNERANGQVYNLVDCYARWADWGQIASDLLDVRVDIDTSSPEQPKNTFTKDLVQQHLGVGMDRGHDGIRDHLRELIAVMQTA